MHEAVAQLIPLIQENRRKFQEFCYALSEEELARPVPNTTWTVKDYATHLATLDIVFTEYLGLVQAGGQVDLRFDVNGAPFNLDAWNDAQVAERHDWSIQQIFAEAATNREKLIETVGRLTGDQLGRSMHFTDPKRGEADFPLRAFLLGWAQHDPIHAADMLRALPERSGDSELDAWLANPFVTGYQASMNAAPNI